MEVIRKSGQEEFYIGSDKQEFRLSDFWQWSQSDILNNTLRGALAEFIVCKALGVELSVRVDWDAFDVAYQHVKIEVKSSAYIQSWFKGKHSKISFDIAPKRVFCYETNCYSADVKRQSDLYVFCLLEHKEKDSVNPLNLEQWKFYVLPTSVLNEKAEHQKSITLNSLLTLNPVACRFSELKPIVDELTTHNE
ncbi:MAG TPA: hypothetical protein VIG72_00535 [Pontibacter sp.]